MTKFFCNNKSFENIITFLYIHTYITLHQSILLIFDSWNFLVCHSYPCPDHVTWKPCWLQETNCRRLTFVVIVTFYPPFSFLIFVFSVSFTLSFVYIIVFLFSILCCFPRNPSVVSIEIMFVWMTSTECKVKLMTGSLGHTTADIAYYGSLWITKTVPRYGFDFGFHIYNIKAISHISVMDCKYPCHVLFGRHI